MLPNLLTLIGTNVLGFFHHLTRSEYNLVDKRHIFVGYVEIVNLLLENLIKLELLRTHLIEYLVKYGLLFLPIVNKCSFRYITCV